MTSEAERIALALGGTRSSNGWWNACCPAHNDANPSLGICEGRNGKTIFKCHGGCSFKQITDALAGMGLWNGSRHKANGSGPPQGKIVKSYDYRDRLGGVLYFVDRYEPKDFRRRPPGSKPNVLYHWPELVAAGPADALFVGEGEKDVERLRALGVVATTVAHGSWNGVDVSDVAGRDVIILEDADEPGVNKALKSAHALKAVAKTIRIVRLPGHEHTAKDHGKDVSDWLEEGHTKQELVDACFAAPLWVPATEITPADSGADLEWRGRTRSGAPVANMHNAQLAIAAIGVECSFDTFHNKLLVDYRGEAHELQHLLGEVTDHAVIALREVLGDRFSTDFGDKHVRDAIVGLANRRRFDPVCDMLDRAQAEWDGIHRLDRMAVQYFNTEKTPLNRAIMRTTMIAAVRRARRPGCKFDNITVLESEEGWLKSTAWRVLAGDKNFSDESILGKSSREVQEQLSEVWIHESADLAGMRKAEVETVKAFASRQEDRARPAYGYFIRNQPRHCINVGTTNSDEYLQSQTGNRRFWPLKVLRRIDVEKLERDRLQLWGEAAACEARGESLTIPQDLWPAAVEEQEKRRVKDPWEEALSNIPKKFYQGFIDGIGSPLLHRVDTKEGNQFVAAADLLEHVLKVPIERQDRYHAMRLADIMKRLGWTRKRMQFDGAERRGFIRFANLANLL